MIQFLVSRALREPRDPSAILGRAAVPAELDTGCPDIRCVARGNHFPKRECGLSLTER
jgi:hypothetical protein